MPLENIKETVREKYGEAAKRASSGRSSACCGTSPSSAEGSCDPITSNLYGESDASVVPEAALQASLVYCPLIDYTYRPTFK
jgi:arsenite methyltransferase